MTGAPSDRLRETYERRAEVQYGTPLQPPRVHVDRKFDKMLALIEQTLPAESLLDAGCGDGRFLAAVARLAARPAHLFGTDISERILETTRQALEREGAVAELVRANLEELPFADASFDRVLCVQVIEHLLDPRLGIGELARVLKPGGVLVLSTDNSHNEVSRILNLPRTGLVRALALTGSRAKVEFPHRAFTCDEVVALAQASGLQVEHLETFRFHIDSLDVALVKRVLYAIDAATHDRHLGDIVAIVARKP